MLLQSTILKIKCIPNIINLIFSGETLGKGGFAKVFSAEEKDAVEHFKRKVAIKVNNIFLRFFLVKIV